MVAGQFKTVNGLSRLYPVRLKFGSKSGSHPVVVTYLNFTTNQRGMSLAVTPAKPFVLQPSTNMVTRSDLSTNTGLASVLNVIDDQIAGLNQRFYQIKQPVP
jgi:hypothetical protein